MTRWFRLYDDVINDPKLLKLPEALRWAWVALLCIASKNGGKLPATDDVALMLRVPEAKAAEYITKLVKAKLFEHQDGVFVPHNWEGRQFKSDSSNERVKKHRDTKRNVTSKQDCNVTSTVTGNVTEGVTPTVTVTPPEAEAETEAESEQSRADAGAPIDEDLKRRASALGAGISAHFVSRNLPIPNLDRCLLWLTQGYAQGTVLAAVETVMKRGKPIATLEYFDGAIRDQHAKAPPAAELLVVSMKVFVEHGTPEWHCHCDDRKRRGLPPPICRDTRIENVIKTGWWFDSRVPEGYDEATYEYHPPADEAVA
ncbi:hypothetical protein ACWX0K_20435 [Nitrobacteraceae bacterium UC4446_H13]